MKTLEERTSKELKSIARKEGVPNWWNLKKADLIKGIKAKQAEAEEAPSEAPMEPVEETKEETKKNTKAEPKRANKKLTELTYKGETKSIRAWAEELNMPWPTLYDRVNRNGWSVEDAIETPLDKGDQNNGKEKIIYCIWK